MKMLINKTCFAYLYLLTSMVLTSSVFAQKTITINDCLESTYNSLKIQSDSEGLSFLKNYNYNLPLINSVDLRSETREFLLNRQEYSLRINPNSLKAISLQKKVYQNRLDKVEIDNQLRFNEELKKRYLLILDYYFTKEIIKLNLKSQSIEKDKLTILSKSIYDETFDIKDLLESEEELLAIELKLSNLQDTKNAQETQLRQFLNISGDFLIFDLENIISAEQVINAPLSDDDKDPIEVTQQKLKLATLKNEMELRKAKSYQILDFLQAKYQSNNDVNFNKDFSIGIGLNIPFFGKNRRRKGDYYFSKLTEESQLSFVEEKVINDRLIVQNEFKNAIMNYQVLNTQIETSSASSILERYKKTDGIPPILILKLVSLQNKKELELVQSKYKLYKIYIEFLAIQGSLFQKPLRNYLSSNNELILN